jgi:hypothetical protein
MPTSKSSSKKTGVKKTSASRKRTTVRRSSKRTLEKKQIISSSSAPTLPPISDYDSLTSTLGFPEYEGTDKTHDESTETISYAHIPTHDVPSKLSRMHYQKTTDYTHELLPTKNQPPTQGKGIFIAGIASLLILIGVFWVWNLTTHFSNITFAAGSDGRLLQDTKTTWQKNFTATNDTLSKSDIAKLTNAITSLTNTSTASVPVTNTTVTIISSPTTTLSTISIPSSGFEPLDTV